MHIKKKTVNRPSNHFIYFHYVVKGSRLEHSFNYVNAKHVTKLCEVWLHPVHSCIQRKCTRNRKCVGRWKTLWGFEKASAGPKSSHRPHPQLSNPLLGSAGRTPLVSASLLIECGSQAALALPNDAVREKCTPKKPLGIRVARNLTRAIFIYCFIYLHFFISCWFWPTCWERGKYLGLKMGIVYFH